MRERALPQRDDRPMWIVVTVTGHYRRTVVRRLPPFLKPDEYVIRLPRHAPAAPRQVLQATVAAPVEASVP